MRRNLAVFLTLFALGFSVAGCKPESHPRRDRKARAGVGQNAADLDSSVATLTADQQALREELLAEIAACKDELRAEFGAALAALQGQVDDLGEAVAALTTKCDTTADKCDRLETILAGLTRDGDTLTFTGVNVRIQDAADGAQAEGLGNLFVGRDAAADYLQFYNREPARTGSNNIVVGGANEFTGSGGLCVGVLNRLNGDNSVVFICENDVTTKFAAVLGGTNNLSQAEFATVGGGRGQVATRRYEFRPCCYHQHGDD